MMGCYDTILVPCPTCGCRYPAQSKSGDCECLVYAFDNAPTEVMYDVNRHAPFTCDECGAVFEVSVMPVPTLLPVDKED